MERDDDFSKAARNGPSQGSGKVAWCPVEVSKTILRPESISVVRCVELFEAQVEKYTSVTAGKRSRQASVTRGYRASPTNYPEAGSTSTHMCII